VGSIYTIFVVFISVYALYSCIIFTCISRRGPAGSRRKTLSCLRKPRTLCPPSLPCASKGAKCRAKRRQARPVTSRGGARGKFGSGTLLSRATPAKNRQVGGDRRISHVDARMAPRDRVLAARHAHMVRWHSPAPGQWHIPAGAQACLSRDPGAC